ncbi:SCO4226 family nickel-binding protein [Arthrobacter sp. SX1312]|uniref:SCO4226 family nickel-binding protein n=1 Tax=Arthrobacter sp. SX1312 TaxID=2058896 RepID=UPI000CE55055|nr:SCO4226 family nickel-binding protein [Arthrobacter sp. SX1312]
MPSFMDVHHNMKGLTKEDLEAAHAADLAIQGEEDVVFRSAWADPEAGVVYCLSDAPSADAVKRIHERTGHPADEVHPVPLAV